MHSNPTVGIIGLGSLGVLFADAFTRALGRDRVLVLADRNRVARYRSEGVWFNGVKSDFTYAIPEEVARPVDLLVFAVKYGGLAAAAEECRSLVGPDTTVISLLNGISSEPLLAQVCGPEKLVWCIARKMTANKEGNRVTCPNIGELVLGVPEGQDTARLRELDAFFTAVSLPHVVTDDIRREKWSKLLVNTGCNQAAMVYACTYAGLQRPGEARDTMIGAMREVVAVANAEGVALSEQDVADWCAVVDGFAPDKEPSMRQDGKHRRPSEVELFSGTIRRLAQKHGIPVPVNDRLYRRVQEMERDYGRR